jgi:hypothetical protein
MSSRRVLLIVAAALGLAAPGAPAAGATASCAKLSDGDFARLGQHVVQRMIGSQAAFEAMNQRMDAVLGAASADRMRQLVGRRYAGCTSVAGTARMMAGAGPMAAGIGGPAMMMAPDLGWMRNGSWQHMSRSQWRDMQRAWTGSGAMMRGGSHHRVSGVVAGVALGGLLMAVLVLGALLYRRRGQPSGGDPSVA